MKFLGKIVIITGAGQGLGAAHARNFATEGAFVVLVGRTEEKLLKVAEHIEADGGKSLVCTADISMEDQVSDMVSRVLKELGTVDILINNAAFHRAGLIEETEKELWDQQISINLTGTFLCCKAVIPTMKANSYGKIINISSSAVKHYFSGFGAYAASKAGIESLTNTLNVELRDYNINVNTVCLGMTNTEYTRERKKQGIGFIPLEEMLHVDDVSRVVMFLGSDDSSSIMGASIDVFGKKA